MDCKLDFLFLKEIKALKMPQNASLNSLVIELSYKYKLPLILKKNFFAFSLEDPKKFFNSKVFVLGCSGLGGFLLEILGRIVIGALLFADGDRFEETNLNRQILCSVKTLNKNKAEVAKKRLKDIAPFCKTVAILDYLDINTVENYIKKADIVVDCTGGIEFKRELIKICQRLNKVIITTAIAGFEGFISTVLSSSKISIDFFKGKESNGTEHTQFGIIVSLCGNCLFNTSTRGNIPYMYRASKSDRQNFMFFLRRFKLSSV